MNVVGTISAYCIAAKYFCYYDYFGLVCFFFRFWPLNGFFFYNFWKVLKTSWSSILQKKNSSATSLVFFDVHSCFGANIYEHCIAQGRTENRKSVVRKSLWNPHTNINKCLRLNYALAESSTASRTLKFKAESVKCELIPQYVSGIRNLFLIEARYIIIPLNKIYFLPDLWVTGEFNLQQSLSITVNSTILLTVNSSIRHLTVRSQNLLTVWNYQL